MTTIEVRLEVAIQNPEQFSSLLGGLRAQGLITDATPTIQSAAASVVAALIPPNSGLEVAYATGKLL